MEKVISIWLQPDTKVRNEIFQIIKNFSKEYKVYRDLRGYKGSHITILEVHGCEENFKTVVDRVENLAAKIEPFALGVEGVGYFMKLNASRKRNFVIYLKVKTSRKLTALKNLVNREFPESTRQEGRGFVPHITITHSELNKKTFYRALEEYRDFDFARNFVVKTVMVSEFDAESKKARIKSIVLGAKA